MTSQRVERTWIRTGGYGRFRGEWVKKREVKSTEEKRVGLGEGAQLHSPIYIYIYMLTESSVSNKLLANVRYL